MKALRCDLTRGRDNEQAGGGLRAGSNKRWDTWCRRFKTDMAMKDKEQTVWSPNVGSRAEGVSRQEGVRGLVHQMLRRDQGQRA